MSAEGGGARARALPRPEGDVRGRTGQLHAPRTRGIGGVGRSRRVRRGVALALAVLGLGSVPVSARSAAAAPSPSASGAITWAPCDPPEDGLQCAQVPVP